MTTQLSPLAVQKFFDSNAIPLVGGKLFTYIAGTSTPQVTYTDSTGGTPNTNPIILNSRGECNVWLTPGQAYKFVLQDAAGNVIWSIDNIFSSVTSDFAINLASTTDTTKGAALVGYLPAFGNATGRTVAAKLSDVVSVKDFGAKGDGLTNDVQAFTYGINYCNSIGGGMLTLPAGRYILGSGLTMLPKVNITGAGWNCTFLQPSFSGSVFTITGVGGSAGSPPDVSVEWHEFCIDCAAQTGVTGFTLTTCHNVEIQGIKFKGCVNNILADRVRTASIHNLFAEGTTTLKTGAFAFTSTDIADYCFEINFYDIHFYNNYTTGTQPILLTVRRNVAFIGNKISLNDGFLGNGGTASKFLVLENDCQGCKFSQIVVAAVDTGITLQQGAGPAVSPTYCDFFSFDVDQPRAQGIVINNSSLYNTFVGGHITSSGIVTTITAVGVLGGAYNSFCGCHVDGFNGVGGAGFNFTGSLNCKVESSILTACTQGIFIGTSTTGLMVMDNNFIGVITQIGGTPAQSGNSIKNNVGHRNTANLAGGVPASGTPVTNNTGYAVTVYSAIGTVTNILVNSVASGLTQGAFRLEPGDNIAINYSAVPTWVWIPSWG